MTGLWRTGPFLGISWFSLGDGLRPVSRRRFSTARWARRRRAARFLLGIHRLHPVAAAGKPPRRNGSGGARWAPSGRARALLGLFRAVFGTAGFAVAGPGGIQGAADDVVADAGQVLNAAAADHHDRVLLQVVPD